MASGNSKTAKKFTPEQITAEAVEFISETLAYDERSAVIVIVAKLDALLYAAIQKITPPTREKHDELLDGEAAPLSTFSAKIIYLYRLRKMDGDLARALHLLRKIRNDFAHSHESRSLNLSPHAERIHEFVRLFADYRKEFDELRANFQRALKPRRDPLAEDFFLVAFLIVLAVVKSLRSSAHWKSRDVRGMTLIPEGWYYARTAPEFERRIKEHIALLRERKR